jgi:hypothetical protein
VRERERKRVSDPIVFVSGFSLHWRLGLGLELGLE